MSENANIELAGLVRQIGLFGDVVINEVLNSI